MAALPAGSSTPHMESELERLYVQIVAEVIAMRVFLPSLAAKGDTGLLERQGQRLLENCGRYVTLVEDHSIGSPPSPAELQRREKQWSYLLHKWKRLCAE